MLKLFEILVPTISNSGVPYTKQYHQQWDKKVIDIAGGLSIMTPLKGKWISDDPFKVYDDKNIPVRIACTVEQLQQIIKVTIDHYTQLAVMAYKISDEVYIIEKE